jgi:hypothetical protein
LSITTTKNIEHPVVYNPFSNMILLYEKLTSVVMITHDACRYITKIINVYHKLISSLKVSSNWNQYNVLVTKRLHALCNNNNQGHSTYWYFQFKGTSIPILSTNWTFCLWCVPLIRFGSLNWPWSTKILGQFVTHMCKFIGQSDVKIHYDITDKKQ